MKGFFITDSFLFLTLWFSFNLCNLAVQHSEVDQLTSFKTLCLRRNIHFFVKKNVRKQLMNRRKLFKKINAIV